MIYLIGNRISFRSMRKEGAGGWSRSPIHAASSNDAVPTTADGEDGWADRPDDAPPPCADDLDDPDAADHYDATQAPQQRPQRHGGTLNTLCAQL